MSNPQSNCDDCIVRNNAICSALSDDELAVLNGKGRKHKLSAGQTLLWEGEEALLVANVIEGVMKLSTSMSDGREQIVGIVYPSDFIGRPFGGRSLHSVTALTDAHVCAFSRRDFDGFARQHPDLEHKLLDRTLTELDRARHWMLLLGRKTAPEKIATFLLEMSDRLAHQNGCGKTPLEIFELPFGRQQIADILGMTIETVSRQLSKLKKDAIIGLPDRRHVEIFDRNRLTLASEMTS